MFQSIVEAVFYYAENTPEALFAADGRQVYTYAQAKNAVIGAAARLTDLGVSRGDCVMVECTQNAAYCICKLAIELLGAVFVPFDRKISEDRKWEMREETGAVCLAGLRTDASGLPFFSIPSINPAAAPEYLDYEFPKAGDRAEILYSTGTTGKSKGVELTHRNNTALAANIASGVGMKPGNVEIVPVALSHSHGLRTLYANFYNGNAAVIASGVTFLKPFFKLFESYYVNAMDLVPSAWRILCEHGADSLQKYQDQIRYVQLGSAPLTDEDKRTLQELLPKSRLYNFYGSTESGRTCTYDFAAYPGKTSCIGKPVINAEVLITDNEHRIMEHSSSEQTGYLSFRGPMNMTGYWKNQDLTASVLINGIFYTRDIGYIDLEGWVYMLGRDDDIINCGGVKINPAEIEEIAMKIEGIADCGCVGHSDPVSGQTPWLFVCLHPDASISEEDITARLAKETDREKLPKRILIIDELPRTFNGKLLRRVLKETADKMD